MGNNDVSIQVLIGSEYPKEVVPIIDFAKNSINILMFDWRWYENGLGSKVQIFNQALVRAVRRGVKVQALVNSEAIIKTLLSVGISAKMCNTKTLLHSKLLCVDSCVSIVGSHNISNRAFCENFETSVIIKNASTSLQFENYFNHLWLL